MHTAAQTVSKLLPYAAEASWVTGRWKALEKYTSLAPPGIGEDFNVKLGRALLALQQQNTDLFKSSLKDLRERIARSLSNATTASLGACRDTMLKLHVLTELEMIAGTDSEGPVQPANVLDSLNRRIEVIGAFLNDKQYLLGIRRAAMQLSRYFLRGILLYMDANLVQLGVLQRGYCISVAHKRSTRTKGQRHTSVIQCCAPCVSTGRRIGNN